MMQPDRDRLTLALRELALGLVRAAQPAALSRTAAGTLSALERLGPARITDLAVREAVTQPAMTGLVQRLEAAGLVARAPDPLDGRASLITLTDEGRAALAARRAQQDAAIRARLDGLAPEHVAALVEALPALVTLTKEPDDDALPLPRT